MAVPTPTIIPSEPCLSDLATLLARAEEEKPEGPGWIHQTLEISQTQPPAMLDSGDMIEEPLNKQTDIWYYLDEDGNAQTTVTIRKTLDGTIYSADISDGPYHFSIPEGRGSIEESIYMAEPSFNLNLLSTFNGYLQEGGSIHTEDSNLDGRTCQLYEARLPYDPPQTFTGEELAVTTLVYSACIDPTSRQVLQVQNHMDYIDGTSKLKGTTRFLVLEKVNSLPEEVSEILESVVIP
jgi:hypothetical protein